ncbi:MAG: hypothetical protein LBE92_17395 [Chryseobacterium sp.]|jgi:hypothetical protein|uniref:hypothetical protein n=1 Tax=Chryseobacterium sp. TaxID=1871047 RepID=UPI00283653F1|nr:hypothetical protein [Chryseobacterium sp.]MDR2237902.1 hypothetical protein [Chryseobacterium sp.]
MKKLATFIVIVLILLPMLVYLNPFTWGMGRQKRYSPSWKTKELMESLNKKYNTNLEIQEGPDTLWYFRDLKTKKIRKLENFRLSSFDSEHLNSKAIPLFVRDFKEKFVHRTYFDSVIVTYGDSVVYKTPIR